MPRRYLNLSLLSDALTAMQRTFPSPDGSETVPLQNAVGRVTAEPLHALYSVPLINIAKFDGYAVRSADTLGARDQHPLPLACHSRINTGEPIPPSFDAVIMVEDTWNDGDGLNIRKPAALWQHIRHAGEDIKSGELIVPKGHQIRPFDIGALATYGITSVDVRLVRVGIVPTGSDLVRLGVRPAPGQTIETNTLMAETYLARMGATCRRYDIVPDDPDRISDAVLMALAENDFVILSAGSSAGTRDYSPDVIRTLGEVVFHGVAVRPGKPVILADVDGKPVLGMPGYPVAAQTVLREFAGRLLEWWGLASGHGEELQAILSRRLSSELGFDEFVPVSVGKVAGTYWASPHPRGGGIQMAVVRANGYFHIPAAREGIEAGEQVSIHLTVPQRTIEHCLICTGVRDPALNQAGNHLYKAGFSLHCCNAGVMGAVSAVLAGTCHAASIALPDTRAALDASVLRYLPGIHLVRVRIARIETGLASKEGVGIDDLKSVRFINRQRGSASRMLTDALLAKYGINSGTITGYATEVRSHDAVASAIINGFADAGICPAYLAARAGLAFSPLGFESLDLFIRREMTDDRGIASLIGAIQSQEFQLELRSMGRYDVDQTGKLDAFTGCTYPPSPKSLRGSAG
jgi:putative molybdopterin biosynthesis protein